METILQSFNEKKASYDSFATSLKSLLNSLLLNERISIHSLETRVKERDSLERKLFKKDKYRSIDEITDIVGVRIITHYADDVERVAEVIEREFSVDKENSIDKRASLAPDRFGYLSLHYIVSLNKNRSILGEHKGYKSLKAEIQIRTILQHAWAEIEHDIGYKSNTRLPDEIKRKFSRLAGLLEIADDEFLKIKDYIEEYREKINREIKHGDSDIPINTLSLFEYAERSNSIDVIFDIINTKSTYKFTPSLNTEHIDIADSVIKGLDFIGIQTINDLDSLIKNNSELAAWRVISMNDRLKDFFSKNNLPKLSVIALLIQAIIALKNDKEVEKNFANKVMTAIPSEGIEGFFERIRTGLAHPH
ncbi:GTP pyrophosphokinase [Serratia marcescens]|uniref:GTP pyrophosphokinase n=1 Tax=Serratia marcescens TaxID=615 RepID=UPI0015F2A294|nr:hypothetical protein [Serratia marcescens]